MSNAGKFCHWLPVASLPLSFRVHWRCPWPALPFPFFCQNCQFLALNTTWGFLPCCCGFHCLPWSGMFSLSSLSLLIQMFCSIPTSRHGWDVFSTPGVHSGVYHLWTPYHRVLLLMVPDNTYIPLYGICCTIFFGFIYSGPSSLIWILGPNVFENVDFFLIWER